VSTSLSKADRLVLLKQAYKRYCRQRERIESVSVCMDSSLFYEDELRDIECLVVPLDPAEPIEYPEMDTTIYNNQPSREEGSLVSSYWDYADHRKLIESLPDGPIRTRHSIMKNSKRTVLIEKGGIRSGKHWFNFSEFFSVNDFICTGEVDDDDDEVYSKVRPSTRE
jgi:hypothetical protein